MRNEPTMPLTDGALLEELGERLARYRLRANLTQDSLAREAGISKRTLERIEKGEGVQLVSFVRLCRALDLLDDLDRWVPEPAPSPIEELRLQGKERRRASSSTQVDSTADPELEGEAAAPWVWGDST